MTDSATDTDIDRVETPSREEFEQNYVRRRKPVILTGVASKWKAYEEWNAEYLRSAAGDQDVTVHYDENADFRDWYNTHPDARRDLEMPLAKLLDLLTDEPPERRYYMTEHSLGLVSPRLEEDLSLSQYISDKLVPGLSSGPCMFLGRDTCMPMHYHATTQAFMCQLKGSKKVTLYGPEQFHDLYPRRWYEAAFVFSKIDGPTQRAIAKQEGHEIDLERYPRLGKTRPLQFTVHPGEILFIPVNWWHLTSAAGFQISMTYFWRIKKTPYHYPSPGLQVHAHDTLNKVKLKLGKLTRKVLGNGDAPAPPNSN